MRLHRLTLRNVKGVTRRTVDFPDTGVVVIEGPNEVGKSTLLEALDRLLDPSCKASSKAKGVQAMQPVGLDAGPFVEAELSVGPYRLVFAKQWLRQTSTVLQILEPTTDHLTGDQAQARMTQILDTCLDRPLFDALRFTQAGELTQIPLADSAVLAAALDGAAGADLHSDSGADLLDQVEREFLGYFTPTGRPTGAYRTAMVEVNEAQAGAVEAHSLVVEAHEMLAARDRTERTLRDLLGQHAALRTARDRTEADVAAATELASAAGAATEREGRARVDAGRADETHRARVALIATVEQRQQAIGTLTQDLTVLEGQIATAAAKRTRAEQAWTAAAEHLDATQKAVERAARDAEHLAEVTELEGLEERMQRIQAVTVTLRVAEAALAEHRVTPAVLRAVTRADQAREVALARVEAVVTVVSVQALADGQVVEVGGFRHTFTTEGSTLQESISRGTDIVVPGAVRLHISPLADAAVLAADLDRAQQVLAELLAEAGLDDVAAAAQACAAQEAAGAKVARLRTEAAVALAGDTVEALAARVDRLRGSVRAAAVKRGGAAPSPGNDHPGSPGAGPDLPPDVTQATAVLRAAQQAVAQARAEITAAEDARDRARAAAADLERSCAVTQTRLEGAQTELATAQESLREARAAVGDADLALNVTHTRNLLAVAEEAAAGTRQALAAVDPSGAEARWRAATEALQTHRSHVDVERDRLNQLKGRIEMAAGEGRLEGYELALQAFEEAKSALMSVDRRARAARHLHQTLQRHREQAHDTYVQPYRAELERLGRQVYGQTFGATVSRDLVITHRRLHGTTVPFDSLSGGAKEQLGILARLAVASLVDPEQGVPVVIDDALGYTDPGRLQRVGEVLADPAATGQVILLTCTPQRYAAIPGATTVVLTA